MTDKSILFNLPKNWVWTTLGELAIVVSGGTPSTKEPRFWGGDIAWVTPADLSNYKEKYITKGSRSITDEGLTNSSAKLLPAGSILFSSRAPIGYVVIAKNEITTNQGFKNLICTKSVYIDYIFHYLKSIKQLAEKMASGTTFLELSANKFSQIPIPLPPLIIQHKIVAKIEELSSKLENSADALKKIKLQLSIYRQSLLEKAFNGEVTRKWREVNGIEASASEISLEEACILITDGSHFSPKSIENGYPYVTVRDIRDDNIDFNNSSRISKEHFEKLKSNGCSPQKGDVLFSKDGTVGKVVNINYNEEFVVLSSIAILRPNPNIILSQYFFYALKSPSFLKQALDNKKGVAIRRIVLRDLKQLTIKIFSVEEQHAIIQALESSFTLIKNLEDCISKEIENIEIFTHSMLGKAFEGKLVEYDSNAGEEASKLLEDIEKEKKEYYKLETESASVNPKKIYKEVTLAELIKKEFSNREFTIEQLKEKSMLSDEKIRKELYEILEAGKLLEAKFSEFKKTRLYKIKS